MNKIIKNTILFGAAMICSSTLTGCLEEAFPVDGKFTEDQIAGADKTALFDGMASYMLSTGSPAYDIGFAAFHIWRDAMVADMPTNMESWDYFRYYNTQLSIGNSTSSTTVWDRYYYLLQKANLTLKNASTELDGEDAFYRGAAYVFRSMVYLDMARQYEYKHTDVAALDKIADERGLWGLTVPLITENTTEAEARKLPRLPFWHMYRFIYNDLCNAESYLANYHTAPTKAMPCLGVAYGFMARFWMELGSRFTLYPDDLATQIANEENAEIAALRPLGVTSAKECFANAATYARKAIGEGFTPLTRTEWYDKSTGFNTPNNSWMWAIIISPDNGLAKGDWKSWAAYMAPEAAYGMAGDAQYDCYRMIDARLYSKIDPNDWRRDTWIDPEFVAITDEDMKKEAFAERYANVTAYDYDRFVKFNAYAGFKYRPGSGNMKTSTVGNVVSIPMMRVEEMYLIEAEALAHSQSPAAGLAALKSFMDTYRMVDGKTFTSSAKELEDVVDVVFTQKRIELWGEGQVWWDYKRRELPIERGYPGTNHPAIYRYNSYPRAVAPWTNFYIPDRVRDLNPMAILNPDPTRAITTQWVEQQ